MATRERPVERGSRRGRHLLRAVGEELRRARVAAGLSQHATGAAAGISAPHVSRIEHGQHEGVSVVMLARLSAVLGSELALRAYPVASPVRDRGHLRLLERLRTRLPPSVSWRAEVPLPLPGDLRAWDAMLRGDGWVLPVEAETRLVDIQSLQRRISLKLRDSTLDRVVLLVADTRTNRRAVADHRGALTEWLPVPGREALRALETGEPPTGGALVAL